MSQSRAGRSVRTASIWDRLRRRPVGGDLAIARRLFEDTGRGGEVSAGHRAAALADLYRGLDDPGRRAYLELLATDFGTAPSAVAAARRMIDAPAGGPDVIGQTVRAALAPRWLPILRQFNLLPDGTKFLVDLRADLREIADGDEPLRALEQELRGLLAEWFDAGFLELRPITWGSPADLLERVAASEAVHAVAGWDDLKHRLDPPDRRFFAFFHPQMPEEPLIFVQVALTRGLASTITSLLDPESAPEDPSRADTATFYSISSAQPGLAGISLGGFLIKRVVDALAAELPNLRRFATLSPVPGLRAWAEADGLHSDTEPAALCARYLLTAKRRDGRVEDPVANFHLSNGTRIERINVDADPSPQGIRQSFGVMVNYLYALEEIEENHEAYASERTVVASTAVTRLDRSSQAA